MEFLTCLSRWLKFHYRSRVSFAARNRRRLVAISAGKRNARPAHLHLYMAMARHEMLSRMIGSRMIGGRVTRGRVSGCHVMAGRVSGVA